MFVIAKEKKKRGQQYLPPSASRDPDAIETIEAFSSQTDVTDFKQRDACARIADSPSLKSFDGGCEVCRRRGVELI